MEFSIIFFIFLNEGFPNCSFFKLKKVVKEFYFQLIALLGELSERGILKSLKDAMLIYIILERFVYLVDL